MTLHLNKPVLAGVIILAAYAGILFLTFLESTLETALVLSTYLWLLVNTYCSVSYTDATFGIRCLSDTILNILLVGFYLGMPLLASTPLAYFFVLAWFFATASLKYSNWVNRIDAPVFLRRKIIVNVLVVHFSLIAVVLLYFLKQEFSILVGAATVYAYGNIHTLVVDPLYRDY